MQQGQLHIKEKGDLKSPAHNFFDAKLFAKRIVIGLYCCALCMPAAWAESTAQPCS